MGHPLAPENRQIRAVLSTIFADWYFDHNNEEDPQMCFVKILPQTGYFHYEGTGYYVNFLEQTVKEFSFAPVIEMK